MKPQLVQRSLQCTPTIFAPQMSHLIGSGGFSLINLTICTHDDFSKIVPDHFKHNSDNLRGCQSFSTPQWSESKTA